MNRKIGAKRKLQTDAIPLDLYKCVQMVKASLNELKKIKKNMSNRILVYNEFIFIMNDEI